jgi:penicillin amidase
VADLIPRLGPDPAAWRWGALHVARFEHPLLRLVPWLADWVRLETPTGGDDSTIARGGMGAAGFGHVHGPGLRLVADLADPDATFASIATGQSGHPLSRHWGDLLPGWRDGAPVRLGRVPAGHGGGDGGQLRLVP